MAFSNPFKTKNRIDATIAVGNTLPKQYRPQRYDLWAKISPDNQNIILHAYDDNGNPKSRGTWQRGPKPIYSDTDPSGAVNEQQTVTVTGGPTGGTFTLTYGGQTTSAIAYNAAASAVQTALQALSSIGSGNATVTGSAGGPYTVTFVGTLASQNVAQMTASGASLTGGTTPGVTVATTVVGVPGNITTDDIILNDLWYSRASGVTVVKSWNGTSFV